MRHSLIILTAGILLSVPVSIDAADARPSAGQVEFFEKTIRPLLIDQCQSCHGSEKHKGGLRLDSREAILHGGDSGAAAVPGKPEASLLIKVVCYKDDLRMPPKAQLKPEQVAALSSWIREGLAWPADRTVQTPPPPPSGEPYRISDRARAFWSFQPIANPPLPRVADASRCQDPIDWFIQAGRETRGLQSVGVADRRALLRRVSFDLIGLPPTPEEVEAFLKDNRPDAFARVVDRLLASPHYGERWARHWLDVARYAEDQSHTFQARLYPNGYRYRDWVVAALNEDMPYDRFVMEQIAADLLPLPDQLKHLPALGFFAIGPVYYGDGKKFDQYDDRIDTLCRGFLGLTIACARCHDHKFDPISMKDYYGLVGVVASSEYVEAPLVPDAEYEAAKAKQTAEEKKKKLPPAVPLAHAIKEAATPVAMRVHVRGNPDVLGEEAPRRFLAILGGEAHPFTKGSGRLELAQAIASKDNPLTARVLVNRLWMHHFGKGLVGTTSNFGSLGERPSHPELLDHLASRFIAGGWSIKKLQRAIVLSATYQQASRLEPRSAEIDPENRLLWRMPRRRLEVEAWRDSMLAASGTLNRTLGGPALDLFAPVNKRRTLYGKISRHELNSLLRLFDFPDPNLTAGERTTTTVPLQQLFVLNSEFMVQNCKSLVSRLNSGADKDDAGRIRSAFVLLYGRPATDQEVDLGLRFLHLPAGKTAGTLSPWEQYAQVLLAASEFLYID